MAREGSASCYLDGVIYCFAGQDKHGNYLQSIERLAYAYDPRAQASASWNLIELVDLTPRSRPVVVVLNSTEILIMGGDRSFDDSCNDVLILKIPAMKCTKLADSGLDGFTAWGNQSVTYAEDKVVAYVRVKSEEQPPKSCVITYKKGDRSVTVIDEFVKY